MRLRAARPRTASPRSPPHPTSAATTQRARRRWNAALRGSVRTSSSRGSTSRCCPVGRSTSACSASLDDDGLRRFTLAASGRYLLVEFPVLGLARRASRRPSTRLGLRGLPGRTCPPRAQPRGAVEPGAPGGGGPPGGARPAHGRVRSTGASAAPPQTAAREAALELGLAHVLASDAHTPDIREAGLAAAAEALERRPAWRAFLTAEAPSAIVAGEAVPDPPPKSRRRR